MDTELWTQTLMNCKRLSQIEEELAFSYYGLRFDDLDEDERGEISMDAYDIFNGNLKQ